MPNEIFDDDDVADEDDEDKEGEEAVNEVPQNDNNTNSQGKHFFWRFLGLNDTKMSIDKLNMMFPFLQMMQIQKTRSFQQIPLLLSSLFLSFYFMAVLFRIKR